MEDDCYSCQEKARQQELQPVEKPEKPKSVGNPSGLCKCGCGRKTPIATRTRNNENVVAGVPIHYCKGHANMRRGKTNGNRRLNEQLVIRLRREYAAGGKSFRAIARQYGIGEQTARQAIRGVSWSHVKDAA